MGKQARGKGGERRTLPKAVRREQLIRATMTCIARSGLSGVTMADVTSEAGLSLGIANLHFTSKDMLLLETLKYVTAGYHREQAAILNAGTDAATRIAALLDFDFSPAVIQRKKLAVWFAFRGEAKSRPTYRRVCVRADFAALAAVGRLFQAAIDEGAYPQLDASLLASGYSALVDGLWLDLLVCPRQLSRARAKQVARHYLAGAFPDHIRMEA